MEAIWVNTGKMNNDSLWRWMRLTDEKTEKRRIGELALLIYRQNMIGSLENIFM